MENHGQKANNPPLQMFHSLLRYEMIRDSLWLEKMNERTVHTELAIILSQCLCLFPSIINPRCSSMRSMYRMPLASNSLAAGVLLLFAGNGGHYGPASRTNLEAKGTVSKTSGKPPLGGDQ